MVGWLALKRWAAVLGAACLGFLAIWFGGRRSAKADLLIEELKNEIETRKDMDQVARVSDADAAREWLSDRAEPERPVRRNSRRKK